MDTDKKVEEILAEIGEEIAAAWKGEAVDERSLLRWLFLWHPLIGVAAGYASGSVTAGILIWGFLSIAQLLGQIRTYACDIRIHLIWLVEYFQKRAVHHLD